MIVRRHLGEKWETVIYSHLNRSRELAPRRKENNVMVRTLIEYITENHDQKYAECTRSRKWNLTTQCVKWSTQCVDQSSSQLNVWGCQVLSI